MNVENINRIKTVFLSTIVCGLLAHAYCYFNLFYSHDSSLLDQTRDVAWKYAIGRWCQPFYLKFRGYIYNPFLVGIFSLVFLACACFLIIEIFEIFDTISIFLVCGVLATNPVLTLVNATYLHEVDMFMLSLLSSVAGVYVYKKFKMGFIPSSVLFAISLGLYQAYIQTAILLFMFLLIKDLLDNINYLTAIKRGIGYVCSLVGGGILYLVGYKILILIKEITPSNNYNSIYGISEMSSTSELLSLICETYMRFYYYFFHPANGHPGLIAWLTKLLFIYCIFALVYIVIKNKVCISNLILIVLSFAFLPLGAYVSYPLSHGVTHELMIYSFFLFIVWAIYLRACRLYCINRNVEKNVIKKKYSIDNIIVYGFCFVFILDSIIYASQVYTKKDIEYQKTYSTLTRVIDRVEQTDGYIMGETPVVFIGNLNDAYWVEQKAYFRYSEIGLGRMFAVGSWVTYNNFMNEVMEYPINLLNENVSLEYEDDIRVKQMGVFPDKDSCIVIDGKVIVKLSE